MVFKARASKMGDLMTNPRLKSETLSETAKTYLKEWLIQTKYNRKNVFTNKYVEKGNLNEEDGVTLASIYFRDYLDTTTEYKKNDYFCGTCDINHEKHGIIDIKNSYSLKTFPIFSEKIPDAKYEDQVRTYFELYNNRKGGVMYVLTDMPLNLLEREIKWLETDDEKQEKAINFIFTLDNWKKAKEQLFPNAGEIDFVEIPKLDRVKFFKVDFSEEWVKKAINKVKESRKYLDNLK